MEAPKRLFDCLPYQLEKHPQAAMLAAKEDGKWKTNSTQQVIEQVNRLSAALLSLGISKGDGTTEGRDKVAIISPNRPEWIMLDLALQQIGAVSVPIYPNINEGELQFVLEDAQVKMAFVDEEDTYRALEKVQGQVVSLKKIFTFTRSEGLPHYGELLEEPDPEILAKVESIKKEIEASELVSLLYTSGTTGTPKGVMLSHRNIMSNAIGASAIIEPVGVTGKRVLSFLPLNHAFERTATYAYLYLGASVYYAEAIEKVALNLKEVKPIFFTTVPRLLEKVYEAIVDKGEELSGMKRKLFFWALELAERYEINQPRPLDYRIQLALADKLIFSKWREALGGNLKSVVTGAAACQIRLLKVFGAAGIPIQEGYGLTEASPIISGNGYHDKDRMFGTVGPVLDNVEVKIAGDGEILCKGPNVMQGYYKRPDLTAEVMEGEWLKTGDLGALVENRFLKITGRKKELFKTSGGKYVAPQHVETKLMESRWIEQIMVVGEHRKFVGALIVPSFQNLKQWYAKQEKTYPGDSAAVKEEAVRDLIEDDVKEFNKGFNSVEQVKRFVLLPEEWTVAKGELTPTLKPKRKVILENYVQEMEDIYPKTK